MCVYEKFIRSRYHVSFRCVSCPSLALLLAAAAATAALPPLLRGLFSVKCCLSCASRECCVYYHLEWRTIISARRTGPSSFWEHVKINGQQIKYRTWFYLFGFIVEFCCCAASTYLSRSLWTFVSELLDSFFSLTHEPKRVLVSCVSPSSNFEANIEFQVTSWGLVFGEDEITSSESLKRISASSRLFVFLPVPFRSYFHPKLVGFRLADTLSSLFPLASLKTH